MEATLPRIWTDGKALQLDRSSDVEKMRQEEDAGARKGREVAKHCVFPVFCGSGGSKSRLAKAADAEVAGQMRNEKLHAVVARSTFASKHVQTLGVRTTFCQFDGASMAKKRAPFVVRTTFGSQKCQKLQVVSLS